MLWPRSTTRNANGAIEIGGVSLPKLAAEFGTPLYIYDEGTLRSRASAMRTAFRSRYPRTQVVYASKAFASPAIIRIFRDEGLGLDVVSGGELIAGLHAGMPAERMTLHGNNKSSAEIRAGLNAGIAHIAIDNLDEIEMVAEIAGELGMTASVLLRLNPGVDVHTHHKIATGVYDSKFGFPIWNGSAAQAVAATLQQPGLRFDGYHMHIGSQLLDWDGYRLAIVAGLEFAASMRDAHGVTPQVFSPGGGFGIAYDAATQEPDINDWATAVIETLHASCERLNLPLPELVVEPGRTLVGPAGVALYEIGTRKVIPGVRTYVSVDGGMADNIRPALYEAQYTAELANRPQGEARERVTLSGRFCESGDLLIHDIDLPPLKRGDLLALPGAGAYCLAMASNYNLAPRPAVVLVNDGKATLIRRRETMEDLLRYEILPNV